MNDQIMHQICIYKHNIHLKKMNVYFKSTFLCKIWCVGPFQKIRILKLFSSLFSYTHKGIQATSMTILWDATGPMFHLQIQLSRDVGSSSAPTLHYFSESKIQDPNFLFRPIFSFCSSYYIYIFIFCYIFINLICVIKHQHKFKLI